MSNALKVKLNAAHPDLVVPKATFFYAVVDSTNNEGSDGPYFTEPGRAVAYKIWEFLSINKNLPHSAGPCSVLNAFDTQLGRDFALNILFPGKKFVLAQISNIEQDLIISDLHTVSINNATVIESPIVMNPDQGLKQMIKMAHKDIKSPYITRTKISFHLDSNILSQQLTWVITDSQQRINLAASFDNIYSYLARNPIQISSLGTSRYPRYTDDNAYRIHRYNDIFNSRFWFDIDWQSVWIEFVKEKFLCHDHIQMRSNFVNVVPTLLSSRREIDRLYLSRDMLSLVIVKCHSVGDATSLGSTCQRYRNAFQNYHNIRFALGTRFLEPFMKSQDIPAVMREDQRHADPQLIRLGGHFFLPRSDRPGTFEIHSPFYADDFSTVNKEGVIEVNSLEPWDMKMANVLPMMRNVNSFLYMWASFNSVAMYNVIPLKLQLKNRLRIEDNEWALTKNKTATTTQSIDAAGQSRGLYYGVLESLSMKGTWMNHNNISPFYLVEDFNVRLSKLKLVEQQRYEIVNYSHTNLITSKQHLDFIKQLLTNKLMISKNDVTQLQFVCCSGPKSESRYCAKIAVDPTFRVYISSLKLLVDLPGPLNLNQVPFELRDVILSSCPHIYLLELDYDKVKEQKEPLFLEAWIKVNNLIRKAFIVDHCDNAKWFTNFN